MKVLVIGSGGREHALVWKIKQSPKVSDIYCAPGNAGIAGLAQCVDIGVTDIKALMTFAVDQGVDLTVVGPEASLTAGIVDAFESKGLRIFGPSGTAAALEGSKAFSKEFLKKYQIPTADFKVFSEAKKAKKYIDKCGAPIVVKADGLAAGKGVIVASTVDQAKDAVDLIMKEKKFGQAGDQVIIEQCLHGEEASFIAFTDGKTVLPLPTSQDHKAVFDNDQGPNTGGMGAYSPAPVVTDEIARFVMDKVMLPTVRGMAAEGRFYKGMLYAGLMIEEGRVNVLEFNCRFGDPEAQPLLMRLKTDIIDIVEATIDGRLAEIELDIDPRPSVCVVMASGGYPGAYETGKQIRGLKTVQDQPDLEIFHAGTRKDKGRLVTAGGRVLGITAIGESIEKARSIAYQAVEIIRWAGCQYRRDIGAKAIGRRTAGAGRAVVGILMGSDSDLPVMRSAAEFFDSMEVPWEMTVASAHRTPELVMEYTRTAPERGIKIIIAGAGMAAHLAGVIASHTDLPVIGVPLDASSLGGLDALLATVQMPPGVPVATMGIGKAGAKNAAVLACRILALEDKQLTQRLQTFRARMVEEVHEKARALKR
jgi:phosphoribosylamine---glycine ligase